VHRSALGHAGAVIRKGTFFACYRARAGVTETGPVSLGKGALVGEAAVLDIETSLGDGAQLGHASSLHAGQAILDGERRCGSPAQQWTEVDYRAVRPANCGTLRRFTYSIAQLSTVLFVTGPLAVGIVVVLVLLVPQLGALLPGSAALPAWILIGEALAFSFVLFFGLMLAGLAVVMTVPRLLNLAIKPDTAYSLYGFRYWAHRGIARITNNTFFHHLLGDSSFIVPYLRCLGYDMSQVEQTGSNFGLEVKHETPYLVSFGPGGTMAADGLSIINADYSSTSFRVSRASIGADSFFGNYIAYPSQARTGDDCLLATKVMVPVDGDMREGVGLLGSPDFEIPRSVERDGKFDHLARGDEFHRGLAAKNKHNAGTIGLYLLTRWLFVFGLTLLAWGAAEFYNSLGALAIALAGVLALVCYVAHFALVERLSTLFRPLQPRYCSIYDPYFWWHERYWKLATQPSILDGTPFKGLACRLLGVRIGRHAFDTAASPWTRR
jgi:non-ribosomal peptide synthetase-like protein